MGGDFLSWRYTLEQEVELGVRLLILTCLLILSAFFSGTETAYFSLDSLQKRRLKDSVKGSRALKLLSNPSDLLSGILFGNTVVNIAASAMAASLAAEMITGIGEWSLAVSVLIMTFLLLIIGEITPKNYAIMHAEKWAERSSLPVKLFLQISQPAIRLFSVFTRFASGLTGFSREDFRLTADDLVTLVEMGRKKNMLGREASAAVALLSLSEMNCTQVMRSRVEVDVIRTGWDRDRIMGIINKTDRTRLPIVDGPSEKVIGFVNIASIISLKENESVQIEELLSFPENAPLESVLENLRRASMEIGAVFDEFGDWTGIITVQDILDAVLHLPLEEETHLPEGASISGDGTLDIPANMRIDTLSRLTGTQLNARWAETCAGMILEETGKIPEAGDEIVIGTLNFRVTLVVGPGIKRLKVRMIGDTDE